MEPAKFARLFAEASEALLAGTHAVESPPVEGGSRWGIAAVLRPDDGAAQVLQGAAAAASGAGCGDHWLAGTAARSHLTLRAGLEPYRSSVPVDDPGVTRYAAALRSAAEQAGVLSAAVSQDPLRFTVTGLTLTPRSVMACAVPDGPVPDRLAARFAATLAGLGLGDVGITPDIWYVNLLYFTGPLHDPEVLIDWVADHRECELARIAVRAIQLVRWHITATGLDPIVLASAT